LKMKPFLLITGMHRSGTSFLARALNLRGVYLGEYQDLMSDDWRPVTDNPRGHWENKKLFEFAEKTLSYSKGSWDNIPDDIKINKKIGKEISKIAKQLLSYPSLASGTKDPRLLLCLDVWLKYLPKNLIIVGIFRNPLKVCESLKNRNQFSYQKSLDLWKRYNENLLYYLENFNGFLLDFDWPKKKLISELDLISQKLGLAQNIDLSEWYTEDLLKSNKTYQDDFPLDKKTTEIYSKLKKRSRENKKEKVRIRQTSQELQKINENLRKEIQNQGNYFKTINEQNLVELHKAKNFVGKLTQEIKNKKTEFSQLDNYITKLKQEIQTKDSELAKDKGYLMKMKQDIQALDDELTKDKDYITKLNQDIKDKDAELAKDKDYITKLNPDIQTKDTELAKDKDYITKLNQDIQTKDTELAKDKDYITKLNQDIQDKENEQLKSKNFVSRLSNEISDKDQEIKNLSIQLKELQEKFDIIKENKPKYFSSRL